MLTGPENPEPATSREHALEVEIALAPGRGEVEDAFAASLVLQVEVPKAR